MAANIFLLPIPILSVHCGFQCAIYMLMEYNIKKAQGQLNFFKRISRRFRDKGQVSSVVLCTGWALRMFNHKVSLPSINRVQTNTVARRDGHHHSLRTEFREEQGLRNSELLNTAYCCRATYIYQLNIFTLARSPPNEHSSKKMQYLTLTEFGVQRGSGL